MPLLLLVSLVWAFSFGLIKGQLAGLDSTAVATLRLVLALAVFLPFLRPAGIGAARALRLAGIGAVQFGLMYLFYQRSYAYLPAYAVVLFTLTTPLFVAGLDAVLARRWHLRYLAAAALALVGSAAVWYQATPTGNFGPGFLLVQLANLCFAAGQLAWRRERAGLPPERTDASLFALPYAGAVVAAGLGSLCFTDWSAVHPTAAQWAVLAYLGVIASGACFFGWNVGAARVNVGTLAVFNNAKVPLGVACSLAFFGEQADLPRLLLGGGLMGLAVWLAADRKR
ncbi:MAG TPA: DMT family transporter [Opitutaceae bacterium]|nr:DMT family transporter [Opitutaceae bacterium]HND62681.1 DMT family transporter [Opitutaceae bacterium]